MSSNIETIGEASGWYSALSQNALKVQQRNAPSCRQLTLVLSPWFTLTLVDGVVITHVNQDDFMIFDDHLQGDPVTEGYGDRMQTGQFSG